MSIKKNCKLFQHYTLTTSQITYNIQIYTENVIYEFTTLIYNNDYTFNSMSLSSHKFPETQHIFMNLIIE
jgi:hypothetical protein